MDARSPHRHLLEVAITAGLSSCALRSPHHLIKMRVIHLLLFLLAISAVAVDFTTTDFAPTPDTTFSIEGKAEAAVYHAFRRKYPDTVPQALPLGLQFEGAAGEAPLLMSIAGGTAPNVIHVNGRQSGSYVARRFLIPLDTFIRHDLSAADAKAQGSFDPDIMYKEEYEARVRETVREAVHRSGPDGDMHSYFLPFSYWVRVLAYNKSLFQEVGLDPDSPPATWDDTLRIGRRIHNPGEDRYGMLVDSGGGASWIALPFFYSMDSRIVTRDPSGEWRAAFNDPGGIAAADFYLQLVDGPWQSPSGDTLHGVGPLRDAWHLWDRGRVGMVLLYMNDILINIDSHIAGMNPSEVGLAPVPRSPINKSTTELHVRGLGITATTKDPEKIRAAWRFIRFVGSPEAEREVIRTYVENGYGNFINPDKLQQHGYTEYLESVPKQWADTLRYSLANSAPAPHGKNCQVYILRASKPLQTAIDQEVARIADPEARQAKLQVLYDHAVAEMNEKMLGHIPDAEMRVRRRVAGIAILVMSIAFFLLARYVWRLFTPEHPPIASKRPRQILPYLLLAPAMLTIVVFSYYPLLRGGVMAFQDYNVLGGSPWVGLDNFANVLYDRDFWISLWRTFEYVVWSLALVFLSPILLAILLSEIPLGKVFLRVVYYLPAVVSGLVVMLMWKLFLDPAPEGLFNQVLGMIGIEPQRWLQDKSLAMLSIIMPLAWATMGPGCLIYLAALKTVPEDLYEAAAIDGAGFFRRLWHVTLPSIRALIFIQLIFVLIGAFQSADNVLVMTGGGPDNATNVIGLEIFYNAYVYLEFGIAIAIAWILGFLLIGLTMIQMRRISNMEFTTAEAD
jgi:ABC-type sugar transport system permease subunit/ABC-type glycerol-3-phosphate transport system substrate-binding protein